MISLHRETGPELVSKASIPAAVRASRYSRVSVALGVLAVIALVAALYYLARKKDAVAGGKVLPFVNEHYSRA